MEATNHRTNLRYLCSRIITLDNGYLMSSYRDWGRMKTISMMKVEFAAAVT
jgi:hypothetical protein